MRGNVLNTLLQVCLQDLNWLQHLVSYCLYYVLKDKTSENSAKKGTYLNAYFWHFWTLAPLLKGVWFRKNNFWQNAGLILGQFYSRYWVIFPMPKSICFSQFLEENSQFQIGKKMKKNHHFYHGKSWLKTVKYSKLHSLIWIHHAMVIIIQHYS